MTHVEISGRSLAVQTWGAGPAEIVLLHDGLGSIRQWRDVPAAIHLRTGRTVLAYDRSGHGTSTPAPTGPWPADWLHTEADVLDALLDRLAIDAPVLVGHSDGGSIALLLAATGRPMGGVVTFAAHTYVEQVCVDFIREMRAASDRWIAGLSRTHPEAAPLFEAWSGVWTGAAFRSWDVRPSLAAIDCPTLVVQGIDDEYATPEHAWSTAAAIGANASCVLLPEIGHLLNREAPDRVVEIVASFGRGLAVAGGRS